jgi:uncharacterized phage protein (TIGR01671 family)
MNKNLFRVFNKVNGKYLNINKNEMFDINHCLNDENYVVEQFTGLVDKNQCKIFEGDIVKYARYRIDVDLDEYGHVERNVVEEGVDEGVIKYSAPSFIREILYQKVKGEMEISFLSKEVLPTDSQRLEIIGNVHQNHKV